MSIIQDALRRKEQDAPPGESAADSKGTGGAGGSRLVFATPIRTAYPSPTPPPVVPPLPVSETVTHPAPPPSQEAQGVGDMPCAGRGRDPKILIIGSVVLLLWLVGGAFFAYQKGWLRGGEHAPVGSGPDSGAVTPVGADPSYGIAGLIEREKIDIAKAVSNTEDAPHPDSEALRPLPGVIPAIQPPVPESALPSASFKNAPEPVVAARENTPSKTSPRTLPGEKNKWPKFVVNGVVEPAMGKPGLVIFDGSDMVNVGQVSEKGILVRGVHGQEAVLEFSGEQKTYYVGKGEK